MLEASDTTIQAQPLRYKPRHYATSPGTMLQAQALRYKPRHYATSLIHYATSLRYKPRHYATSPRITLQASGTTLKAGKSYVLLPMKSSEYSTDQSYRLQ
jgi:hypothetical protein